MGLWFGRYWPIELAVAEKTLFALPPINRIVPILLAQGPGPDVGVFVD
jgi:hypothetical protein